MLVVTTWKVWVPNAVTSLDIFISARGNRVSSTTLSNNNKDGRNIPNKHLIAIYKKFINIFSMKLINIFILKGFSLILIFICLKYTFLTQLDLFVFAIF
ncbi:hypothetical protein PUN28_004746 [Cardiocondyla obscurior]|uniref:Uncharacterized protein n=1 Tax=Cardiocondyla obscurior TaxID=286306 RepID=A0AAW2GE79_9HYME